MSTTGGTEPDEAGALDPAVRLLDERKYDQAIEILDSAAAVEPTGTAHALLGLAYFQRQDYATAATHYEAALERDPGRADWRDMGERTRANAVARVDVAVPEVGYFDSAKLLAPPSVPPGTLPAPPAGPAPRTRLGTVGRVLGNVLGAIATFAMGLFTRLAGTIVGYRGRVWTNWYRRPLWLGILVLAHMREKLNRDNLKNTYPDGALVGFQRRGQTPPEGASHFRTADGSWNNLDDPMEGAAGTRFQRNVANASIHPATGVDLMTPNPREISRALLTRTGPMKEVPFLNLLAASWIQFQTHDWVSHGETVFGRPHEIPLAEDDPARTRYRQTKMLVGGTQPDPTRANGGEETPITFINEVTHWWDGSQIYGSDQRTVDRLRSGVGGRLRLNDDGTLPVAASGAEDTGFVRNWWLGLAMLHTLFAREHNAICELLHELYPRWGDNRLFNVARLVNAAVMAKIHTVEWTPAILPNRSLDAGLNANWFGLATNFLRTGKRRKTVAGINIRNPELGGVVGNPIDKHGQPYALTEEFVEVYRLHSLLPETLAIRRIGVADRVEELALTETRQEGSRRITARVPMADLFYSFGNQHPGQLVLNNYPRFMQEMSIPGNPLVDLAAVDILRARERGVPRYNEFRRQMGLNPIRTLDDLTDDEEHLAKLKRVYGDGPGAVEQLDLMIGTLAEGHRPDHFGFGETLFQIFILNATRRLQADRFYTDNYDEQTYTAEGLEWIDACDFKSVLLRHYPDLARTGLANVRNAFEPWDTSERLDPGRHPLRAYDKELRADPWRGDARR